MLRGSNAAATAGARCAGVGGGSAEVGGGGEVGPHEVKGTTWTTTRLVGFATVARQRGCGMRTRVIGMLQCRRRWLEPRQFQQRTGSWQSATR
jgi:hypothetical protein